MLFGYNLNDLFLFPVQDQDARKHFLIGCLIYLAGFIIPILPWIVATGYIAILIRQVLNGEKPHLVPWENWEALLKDGARLFGVRLIYASPLLVLFFLMMLAVFALPFFAGLAQNDSNPDFGMAPLLFPLVLGGASLLIMPLSLAIGLIVPAAEIHVIAQDSFQAGFKVQEWWPIFKKNWGGFVVALAILYGISMLMSIVMQIMIFTVVLLCLFPFFLPVISMYSAVVQYAAFTQAYKEGRDKLRLDASTS